MIYASAKFSTQYNTYVWYWLCIVQRILCIMRFRAMRGVLVLVHNYLLASPQSNNRAPRFDSIPDWACYGDALFDQLLSIDDFLDICGIKCIVDRPIVQIDHVGRDSWKKDGFHRCFGLAIVQMFFGGLVVLKFGSKYE